MQSLGWVHFLGRNLVTGGQRLKNVCYTYSLKCSSRINSFAQHCTYSTCLSERPLFCRNYHFVFFIDDHNNDHRSGYRVQASSRFTISVITIKYLNPVFLIFLCYNIYVRVTLHYNMQVYKPSIYASIGRFTRKLAGWAGLMKSCSHFSRQTQSYSIGSL